MAATTNIGATLHISSTLPNTEDETGFEAVTYTKIGRVDRIGSLGDTFDTIPDDNLETGRRDMLKGMKDPGALDVDITYESADSGQDLVETANESLTGTYAFKYSTADGESRYFIGRVANLTLGEAGSSSKKMMTFVIYRTTQVFGPYSS